MKDIVTIVIPVYNVADFLPACLDSVISQTYENLQILLVDDGSTDTSGKICDEYALEDSRIEVVHKKNGGLSDARNIGIKKARGMYIAFIDSDDIVDVSLIDYLYEILTSNDADISCCQKKDIDERGFFISEKKYPLLDNIIFLDNKKCMHGFVTESKISVTAWGKLYRTDLFRDIFYPIGKYHEDVFTTYKLIAQSNIIIVGKEYKYFYRQRKNSIMRQAFSHKHFDAIEAKIEIANYMKVFYPIEYACACADVVSSANICLYRMGCSNSFNRNYFAYLKKIYKDYWLYFIFYSKSHYYSRLFAIIARLNPLLAYRIIFIFNTLKKFIG